MKGICFARGELRRLPVGTGRQIMSRCLLLWEHAQICTPITSRRLLLRKCQPRRHNRQFTAKTASRSAPTTVPTHGTAAQPVHKPVAANSEETSLHADLEAQNRQQKGNKQCLHRQCRLLFFTAKDLPMILQQRLLVLLFPDYQATRSASILLLYSDHLLISLQLAPVPCSLPGSGSCKPV